MSNLNIRLNPLTGVESVHIKKGVKWALMGSGILLLVIVIGVIAQKGQHTKTSSDETPTQIDTTMTAKQSSLDAVLAQKPTTAIPKAAAVTPEKVATPNIPQITPEQAAWQKEQVALKAAKQKRLDAAVSAGMNVRIDSAALQINASKSTQDDELSQAQARLIQAKAQLNAGENIPPTSVSEPSTATELDTTVASQQRKAAFLAQSNQAGYLQATRELPASEFELTVGTLIPATLISAINSDIPGNIIAQVSQNVYDSATGTSVLIPQGTQLYGTYDAQVAYGQRRLPVTWSRVNFPDGTKLNIGNMASVDTTGMNGLTGEVNNHYWRLFGQATLLGGISGLSQAAVSDGDDSSRTTGESVADGITQQYAETGNMLIRKNMNIQPTIEVDNAEQFYIMVSQDVLLPPYSAIR